MTFHWGGCVQSLLFFIEEIEMSTTKILALLGLILAFLAVVLSFAGVGGNVQFLLVAGGIILVAIAVLIAPV